MIEWRLVWLYLDSNEGALVDGSGLAKVWHLLLSLGMLCHHQNNHQKNYTTRNLAFF
jgi:hypothetical protein